MKWLNKVREFDWDKGNQSKNFIKHQVSDAECEEMFFDLRKKIAKDKIHSGREQRYFLIGRTKNGRLLFLVFTIRREKVRVISARDLNKKEKNLYEKTN